MFTLRHIILKLLKTKDKEKILKTAKVKRNNTQRKKKISIRAKILSETMQARRQWNDIFNQLKEKNIFSKRIFQI